MTKGARRGLLFLLVLVLVLFGGTYYLSARSVNSVARQQAALHKQQVALAKQQAALRIEQQAQCKFDADLGAAPVVAPKGLKPSLLGVTIVSDDRIAWHGLHCPGHLPPAARSFVRWARVYHLPYK